MKRFFIRLSFGLMLAAAGGPASSAAPLKVGIGAEPYPPFSSPDASGQWHGWEIDFASALCKEIKVACVTTPVAWDGIIPALTTGKLDMIVGSLSITPERMKVIDFSDKYYNTPALVVGLKSLKFTATPEGLKGKTIGVQSSTIHQAYAMKYFAPAGAKIKEYPTQDEADNDLAAGRLDAGLADSLVYQAFLAAAGKACCEKKGVVADDPEILGRGIGVGFRKGNEALKNKVNAAIKTIRANGTYAAITKKYFDFDIYGQ